MEFSLSTFDVSQLDNYFRKNYSTNIRLFLIELKEFLTSVESVARIEDPFEVSHLKIKHSFCNGDVLFYLHFSDCSKKYGKIIRRKFGLNSLETISFLYKFSVSLDTICLFVHGEIL